MSNESEVSLSNSKIGLHIGLPKTGTTSLQMNCFNMHSELAYFGQTNFRENEKASAILKSLLGVTKEHETGAVNAIIKEELNRNRALMISDEAMTMGEFMVRAKHWPIQTNHQDNAIRAKTILGDAHVFIVFRNQVDWLVSWHQQGLFSKKYTNRNFDEWFNVEFDQSREALLTLLDYEKLYTAYRDVFGVERVSAYFFEQYQRQGFGQLAADMVAKLGVDPLFAKVTMGHSAKNRIKDRLIDESNVVINQSTALLKESVIKRFNKSNIALFSSLNGNSLTNVNEFRSKYIVDI